MNVFSTDLTNHQEKCESLKKEKNVQLVHVPIKRRHKGLWLYAVTNRNIKVQSLCAGPLVSNAAESPQSVYKKKLF